MSKTGQAGVTIQVLHSATPVVLSVHILKLKAFKNTTLEA